MTRKAKHNGLFICRILVLCLVCVIALAPFYVAFCYAFKSKVEIAKTKLAFPTSLYLGNFAEAIGLSNYFNSFKNSIIVAACVIIIVVLSCSTAAYIIARKKTRFYNTDAHFAPPVVLQTYSPRRTCSSISKYSSSVTGTNRMCSPAENRTGGVRCGS